MMQRIPEESLPPIFIRILLSIGAPIIGAVIISQSIINILGGENNGLAVSSIFLGLIGLLSWFMGLRWYGIKGLGLRGGRPLFSSSGFAFLGWVVILIIRFLMVSIDQDLFLQQRLWQDFIYLLLFEAFVVHLWVFGLLFRSLSESYGGLTAAVISGLVFGLFGFYIFRESFQTALLPLLYFLLWGVFYGVIRLRTGSIIGTIIVQAMQSLTTWFLFPPIQPVMPENFNQFFYIYMGIWYAVLIWRLWPKELEDYRI